MKKLMVFIFVPCETAIALEDNAQFLHELQGICDYTINTEVDMHFHPSANQIAIVYLPEKEITRASADFFKKAEVDPRIFVITEQPKFMKKAKAPNGMTTERILKKARFSPDLLLAFVKIMHRAFS